MNANRLLSAVAAALAVLALGVLTWRLVVPGPFVQPETHAAALDTLPVLGGEEAPEAWTQAHLQSPTPPQGPAPPEWSAVEASLSPQSCGVCHPQQLADWKDSWHALGMGPGMMGQLVDDDVTPGFVQQCQRCHAPLHEQHPQVKAGDDAWAPNPNHDEALRLAGLTCAGCHVRGHTRYGPPRREGVEPVDDAPHGGFEVRAEFQDPRFCWSCHDFTKKQLALEGKLLQETYEEWRRTAYARDGVTCQSCHMSEGRHLWRGIHDPDTVRAAMTAEAALEHPGHLLWPVQARLTVTNTGAGHRFPTYSTPWVQLVVEQVDATGAPIQGTRQVGTVARRVTPDLKREVFDTRLMPGESFTVAYAGRRRPQAVALRAAVEVWPDEQYRQNYTIWLKSPEKRPKGAPLLQEALEAATASRFVAWETRLDLVP